MKPNTTPGVPAPAMKKTTTTLSLDRALLDAARTEARLHGASLSAWIETRVTAALAPAAAPSLPTHPANPDLNIEP